MTLIHWLNKIKTLHCQTIDLGLDRIKKVADRLKLQKKCPIVTIGGTNGKGSTVAGLNAIFQEAGYRVGSFTSPFLIRFNEQIQIQGQPVKDESLILAFQQIEAARGNITLTPFEYHTLAAFIIFQSQALDIWLLEVGLGGRLDAVNLLDSDVAIVTSIDLDHTDWLGETREKIAFEKAGIFRAHQPAICGDINPPHSLIDYAASLSTPLFCQGKQFGFEKKANAWDWWCDEKRICHLPIPRLALLNMSTVLMAVYKLEKMFPLKANTLQKALKKVQLPGRIQVIPGKVVLLFDVSHNPASARQLADYLKHHLIEGKTRAVFSMLGDKDIKTTLAIMKPMIDEWMIAPLQVDRAASLGTLTALFTECGIAALEIYSSIEVAYQQALNLSQTGDRIVVFGSFHTVGQVLKKQKS